MYKNQHCQNKKEKLTKLERVKPAAADWSAKGQNMWMKKSVVKNMWRLENI